MGSSAIRLGPMWSDGVISHTPNEIFNCITVCEVVTRTGLWLGCGTHIYVYSVVEKERDLQVVSD